jgi:hypothetical protein
MPGEEEPLSVCGKQTEGYQTMGLTAAHRLGLRERIASLGFSNRYTATIVVIVEVFRFFQPLHHPLCSDWIFV